MHIVVKGHNVEVTDSLRQYAEKRVGKISKYFDSIISADVTLSLERSWHIIEVTVFAPGFVLHGEERTNDMYSSIDKVTDKLESQIKKQKGKHSSKGRTSHVAGGLQSEEAGTASAVAVMTETEDGGLLDTELHIEKVKRFTGNPMGIDQAVKELEGLGYEFFVFCNSATSRVNVLYRRARGYGLIDPVLD